MATTLWKGNIALTVDWEQAAVTSLRVGERELVSAALPLFSLCLRSAAGERVTLDATDAARRELLPEGACYSDFPEAGIRVRVTLSAGDGALALWHIAVENGSAFAPEYVLFPRISLPPLKKNGGIGEVLFPYNEGAIVDDLLQREQSPFPHREPEYPSLGAYSVFPNMIASQFLCYLFEGKCLYFGLHDPARAPKGIDFARVSEAGDITPEFRLFCGCDPGEGFTADYPIVWDVLDGGWQDGAEKYRTWLEAHLPAGARKILENGDLPAWYGQMPLVVTYPLRGWYDTDRMTPNPLFYPYKNALPLLEELREKTGCPLLVLLMHWEGTAPWAPPYVYPPFGREGELAEFADALHARGDTLGVYCSGFGYTLQSRLLPEYDREAEYARRGLSEAMCASPAGEVELSRICTAQRKGYDICVASEKGKALLNEAYHPLFDSKVDYVQILDQNHGGGQYFCYSRAHGHPFTPGKWMTEEMQDFLADWNARAGQKLFGCESAAAEAFFPSLLFSDNRYILNWHIGRPVPLYAYLYHEYLHNFMGNQVYSGILQEPDSLCYRVAYSFAAGDCLTLPIRPDGQLYDSWGSRDFASAPDRDAVLTLIGNLRKLYEGARAFLSWGRMIKDPPIQAPTVTMTTSGGRIEVPTVLSSAWEVGDERIRLLVNHTGTEQTVRVDSGVYTVPALSGRKLPL